MTSDERAPALRWGVIGATSRVARLAVMPAIAASPTARLVAVASEGGPAAPPGDARVYSRYEALLDDPDVEAVYVPLPNSLHRSWVERAAAASKHVLCEKPLAPTVADAKAMAAACAAAGVTLREAYMTPFHPRAAAVDALVASGRLGDLRFARAAFTSVLDRPGDHRWRPEMGGGALLDVGTYCVAPLLRAAGRAPVRVEAAAVRSTSGVESAIAGWLDFGQGFAAAIECAFDAPERQSLEIVGTEAAVVLERAFTPGHADTRFSLQRRDGRAETVESRGADPYRAMIEAFHAAVRGAARAGSIAASIAVAAVLDRLREAAGLEPALAALMSARRTAPGDLPPRS